MQVTKQLVGKGLDKFKDMFKLLTYVLTDLVFAPARGYRFCEKKIKTKVYAVALERARGTQPLLGWNGNTFYMKSESKFLWCWASFARGTVELKRLGHSDVYIVSDTKGKIYRNASGDIVFDYEAARAVAILALEDNASPEMPGFGKDNAFGTYWCFNHTVNSTFLGQLDYRLYMKHPSKREGLICYVSVDTKPGLARIQCGPWGSHAVIAKAPLVVEAIDDLFGALRLKIRDAEQSLATLPSDSRLLR